MIKMYSILDKATGSHSFPFGQPTDAAAVRVIRNEMANTDSMLAKHPSDYELWLVGEFDEVNGYVKPYNERVVSLHTLINS